MNPELKRAMHWMSPINFDGNPLGAVVRTVEMAAVDIGGILVLHSLGMDCSGPIAIGTFILMGVQFAACPRHETVHRSAARKFWSIRSDDPDDGSH